jgi:hypothetical protein
MGLSKNGVAWTALGPAWTKDEKNAPVDYGKVVGKVVTQVAIESERPLRFALPAVASVHWHRVHHYYGLI